MKKIIIVLFTTIFLFTINSCKVDGEINYDIKEALKISAWVLDKSREETGYWVPDNKFSNRGYWVDESTAQRVDDDVFELDRLKLNDIRVMAPLGYMAENLNILIEFDGIIEVEIENENEYIRLSYNANNPSTPGITLSKQISSGSVKNALSFYVNVCPLGVYTETTHIVRSVTKTGSEYHLLVKAYKFSNEEVPYVKARLKLVALEDKAIALADYSLRGSSDNESWSRFLSIELVSYEFDDMYKLMYGIDEDEE